jgi:hypothetical protein
VIRDGVVVLVEGVTRSDKPPAVVKTYDIRGFAHRIPSARIEDCFAQLMNDGYNSARTASYRGLLVVEANRKLHERVAALLSAIEEHCTQRVTSASGLPQVVPVEQSDAQRRIEKALSQPVYFDSCGVLFDESLRQLTDELDLPLRIHAERSILDQPIYVRADGELLATALALLLQPNGLSYTVHDGYLDVSPASDDAPPDIRLYCVGDLLDNWGGTATFREVITSFVVPGADVAIERIHDEWLAVSADWRTHHRIEDWLVEQITGTCPRRELERRATEQELQPGAGATRSLPWPHDPFATPK